MKKALLFLVLLLIAVAIVLLLKRPGAATGQLDSLVRIHFAGADAISSDTNSTAFTNEFCSAEARVLESQTLDKLSRAPGAWFDNQLSASTNEGSALLRPLLDDFLKSEWFFQMSGSPAAPEYAVAIHLDASRAQLWQTNLRSALESWTGVKARDISNGWEVKRDSSPSLFRFICTGDWVVIGCGDNELPLSEQWSEAGKISENDGNWLSVDLDWPRLAQKFSAFAKFDFPAIKMQFVGMNGNFQVNGKFELSQPLPSLEEWQTPTNIIHRPLSSFTAVRGFAPWLEEQTWAKWLVLSPEPDQAFIWSLRDPGQETFLAVPVANATNALAQLGHNLVADTNWENHLFMSFTTDVASNRISWENVPFITPEVLALNEPSGDCLLTDVSPFIPRGKGPQQQLLLALDRDNLVFYHWEITADRLEELPQLTQLALFFANRRQLELDSAAGKWLKLIGPTLGNCVTEVTQTGPTELTLSRTAPAGLTAIELIALANWLEAPNFPGCDLRVPSAPPIILHHKHKKLAAPAASPPPAAR